MSLVEGIKRQPRDRHRRQLNTHLAKNKVVVNHRAIAVATTKFKQHRLARANRLERQRADNSKAASVTELRVG